jgi:hypothetical protein
MDAARMVTDCLESGNKLFVDVTKESAVRANTEEKYGRASKWLNIPRKAVGPEGFQKREMLLLTASPSQKRKRGGVTAVSLM